VWVGNYFDNLTVRSPNNGDILGGFVCVDGTAFDNVCFDYYVVESSPVGAESWMPVEPGTPLYTNTVINDPLAAWNTIAGGVPDGDYRIRVRAADVCGNTSQEVRTITVDNTAPIADISQPFACETVDGLVKIIGTAVDAHLAGWVLQYTGGGALGWVTIASGNTNVFNDVLTEWNTAGLRPCAYTLRLVVTDEAVLNCNGALRHQTEYLVSVTVGEGVCGDCDGDGDVDLLDWQEIEVNFDGP